MNTFRRLPVTLVLVDAGPLISLAACDRLDLLDSFERKVRIVDVVMHECLRDLERTGARRLHQWFSNLDGDKFAIEPTPLLDAWFAAIDREANGDRTKPTQQIGDAAIALAIRRFSLPTSVAEVILLLLEDSGLGDGAIKLDHPEVYALSTRAFLATLENFGRIPSAAAVMEDIAATGRRLSPYTADRPGRLGKGVKSQWTEELSPVRQDEGPDV